jgi:peptidyl-prolyl cis-trans isomerase SurA
MVNELKNKYQISFNSEAKPYFESILNNDYYARTWRLPDDFEKDNTAFTINNRPVKYNEFGRHLMAAQRNYTAQNVPAEQIIEKEFKTFFEKSILQYREDNLELENKDFANILKEYRDGLLLFDLMEKEVWNKAAKDTVGLEAYYEKNKSKYQWQDRVDVVIATSANDKLMPTILKMLKRGKTQEEISQKLNSGKTQNVIFTKGIYKANDGKLPDDFELKEGLSKIYNHNEAYHIIDVKEILQARIKTLEEAKGNVINDYQMQLEADWMDNLRQRFSVEVNQKALNAVKAKIKN